MGSTSVSPVEHRGAAGLVGQKMQHGTRVEGAPPPRQRIEFAGVVEDHAETKAPSASATPTWMRMTSIADSNWTGMGSCPPCAGAASAMASATATGMLMIGRDPLFMGAETSSPWWKTHGSGHAAYDTGAKPFGGD